MPKYDYRCSAGHQYEKREGFDAPAVQTCEVCGEEARRVLTPPAIVFKGSGWYVTDSRKTSEASSPAGSNGSSSSDSSSSSSSSSTESKSDTSSKSSTPAAAD
ncbi:MAG: FmdB family zinc ribbon protein [Dehalococcoidia bacterium]